MTRSAGVYVRISDDRVGAGLGVDRQEKDCRAVAARLGWEVGHVYVDNDLTAFDKSSRAKTRPDYEALKVDLLSGQVNAVIVWHTDRLHRTPRELEDFIDICEALNLPVETAKAGVVDLGSPSGRAVARTLCAWAYYESEHKSERISAKYVQLAEAGLPGNGGFRPFGYSKDRLTVVEDEALHLRWAYSQVISGRALRSITSDLNDRGVTSTQGKPWTVQALRYNLLSPRNTALREHRGVVVGPAVWPPVVDRETWERTQAILRTPGRQSDRRDGTTPTNARRHFLTGFLWCGRCDGKLVPRTAGGVPQRYGCLPSRDGGCGGATTRIDYTDQAITSLLMDRLERDADLTPAEATDPTAALLEVIAADEQRLRDLADAFADDPDPNALEFRRAGARIRKRIAATRQEITRASVRVLIVDPLRVREAWPDYDLQQRRHVLSTLIERISVGPGVPGRFDPNRLTVTWR